MEFDLRCKERRKKIFRFDLRKEHRLRERERERERERDCEERKERDRL